MADISKITLPSNDEYNIKDATARQNIAGKQDAITVDGILQGDGEGNISAADTQEVTTLVIDSSPERDSDHLITSGGVWTAIQNAGGGGTSLPSQSEHSGEFLTTDGENVSWAAAPVTSVNSKTGAVTLSNTDVGAAATSHTHGKIQNNGTLQTTDVSIENGDKLVVTDANSTTANQIVRSNISFDGSTTSKYLSQKGTWESLPTDNDHRDSGYGQIKAGTASSSTSAITANTTTAQASTYNELLTINPGNKWVSVAANNSSTSGSDTFTIGHSAGLTAKTSYGSTATTASADGGTITITDVKYDEAGHITGSTDRTITLSQSDEIFIAEYSVTTYSELKTAYDAGKTIFLYCDWENSGEYNNYIPLVEFYDANDSSDNDLFTFILSYPNQIYTFCCSNTTPASSAWYRSDSAYFPSAHASTSTTYGVGNASNYGHVKLSDSTSSTNDTSNGIAATPAAVKAAYDKANNAVPKTVSSNPGTSTISHTWDGFSISITTAIDGNNSFAVNSDSTEIHNVVTPTANGDAVPKSYVDNAISNIDALPSQTNNSGKFLTTNGTSASWATVSIPTVPTMDASPTDGNSSNTVSSNGVYDMVMGRTKIYTGSCSTAAATAEKVVTLDDATGFSLTTGTKVAVTFSNANTTTGTTTLNVNGTGAKNVVFYSDDEAGGYYTAGAIYNQWGTKETLIFTYTGTSWCHTPSQYFTDLTYNLAAGRQTKITASGILKGEGSGTVSAAVAGTDYQAPLPSQTNNSGKFLTTNGSALSWDSQIFIATSSTTQAQIDAALEDGKICFYESAEGPAPLIGRFENPDSELIHVFLGTGQDHAGHFDYTFCKDNSWSHSGFTAVSDSSPTFYGTPKAPTAAAGTNTTQIATTAFVNTAILGAIGGSY